MRSLARLFAAAGIGLTLIAPALSHEDLTTPTRAESDEYRTLHNRYAIEKLRDDLDAERRSSAQARLQARTDELKLEALSYPEIRVNRAEIFQISKPENQCNATYFAQWKCHGLDKADSNDVLSKCDFPVNASICGQPGSSSEPQMLEITYSCGATLKTQQFAFGTNAYLTCQ